MRRRDFLAVVGAGALGLAMANVGCATGSLGLAKRALRRPPNIVLIVMDDFGYADLGCYGSTFHETPRLDAFAAEGVRFTDAYAACPVCSPTRASLMTGRYPARLGLTDFLKGKRSPADSPLLPAPYKDQLDAEEVTVAEALREAGYATAHIGKWHLGAEPFWPEHQGFDVNIGGSDSGMPRSYFWPDWKDNPPIVGRKEGEYLTDRLNDDACAFIESHADKPFFINLCHYAVHIPLGAKGELYTKYKAKLEAQPPEPGRQCNPYYAAMIESMDQGVGRILDTLARLKLDENTLVVFTSDNGGLSVLEGPRTPATSNFPLREGKGYLYEGGIRVPLIVRGFGVRKPGSTCAEPVCSTDLFPTFAAMAGARSDSAVDGVNLKPLLRHPSRSLEREALYWHYPHFSNQGGRPGAAVRCGAWKLLEFYETNKLELYNLTDDIGEEHDRAAEQPGITQRLHQMLLDWRESVGANMPLPNPAYHG